MAAKKSLSAGITRFSELEDEDKDWVIDSLRKDRQLPQELTKLIATALFNQTSKPYVFLSHSSKDKRFVRGLAHQLKSAGIRVWLDEAAIKVGESLIQKLRQAIDSVDFLIVVLSQASIESAWVQKEVEMAMNYEIKKRKIKVLPILKEAVPLPGFLEGKVYLDFTTKFTRAKSSKRLVEHILSYDRKAGESLKIME